MSEVDVECVSAYLSKFFIKEVYVNPHYGWLSFLFPNLLSKNSGVYCPRHSLSERMREKNSKVVAK